MNKKMVKILSTILIVLMLLSTVSTVFAAISIPTGNTGASGASNLNSIINAILGIAQVIGVGVAVIFLVVVAITYISAAPGDKAEIKKHAIIYVVGAVILFAASGILGIIQKLAGNVK